MVNISAFVEENNNNISNNINTNESFFPANAKTQESSQEYQAEQAEPASFSYANFEQKLGHIENNDFRQNVTTYQEPVSDFRQNLEPVNVKKPLGLSAVHIHTFEGVDNS